MFTDYDYWMDIFPLVDHLFFSNNNVLISYYILQFSSSLNVPYCAALTKINQNDLAILLFFRYKPIYEMFADYDH